MTRNGYTATSCSSRPASACWRCSRRCPRPSGARSPGLHPDRAPTIVAGVVILIEAMRAFGLEAMETSEADILHGAALSSISEHSGRKF